MIPRVGLGPVPVAPAPTVSAASLGFEAEAAEELRRLLSAPAPARLHSDLPLYLTDENEAPLVNAAPDICLIDFDRDPRRALRTAERIHQLLPRAALFAVSAAAEPQRIVEAMRCGCTEYLQFPLQSQALAEAVARVGGRKRESRPRSAGRVLLFSGTKGGCGVTTIATHAAAMLAQSFARKVLLVDLHPALGDAALSLGLTRHTYNFYQLVESLERLDDDLLQSFLLQHSSGLEILPAPEEAQSGRRVAPAAVGQVIDFVRRRYDLVLIDCPPGLDQECIELLPRADQLVLVTLAEVSALRNLASCLEYLKRSDFDGAKIEVVLNRHLRRSAISDEQVTRAIRREINLKVPNRYDEVMRTISAGDPVGNLSSSEVARAVMEWARGLSSACEPPAAAAPAKGGRFLGLWGGRR